MITFHRAHLNSARCGADLSNGSERSLYVPMSYIFKKLGRPHRAINIMFTYYPFDKGWPKRSSELVKWKKGMDLWDLPYDDYIPFTGIVDKDQHAESIKQFRDIRRFGQDIHFTLTIDPKTPKKTLRKIAEGLKPYGRVFFRINHECNGFWFQHNKRYSYKTVSDFFIEFHNIIKEKAPLVKTVFCLNGTLEKEELHLGNDELAGAVRVADIIGLDRYLSLNYGWPSPWKKNSTQYFNDNVDEWWSILKFCYKSIRDVRKHDFPMTLPETNADAEVNGPYGQAKRIQQMYEMIRNEKEMHIGAVTLYQFRDRGGLGLEKENPKTKKIAGTCPSISAYRKATSDPFYNPVIKTDSLQLIMSLT